MAWLSSDETVAEVSDGTVTAKKPGAAAILAASGGKYACCAVRVREAEVPGGDRGPEPDRPDIEAGGDCGP